MSETLVSKIVKNLQAFYLIYGKNPWFVTAGSAASGALANYIQSEWSTGHVDFSILGFKKLIGFVGTAVFMALFHLYLPQPSQQSK